jgi:hypothetical protein
MEYFILVPKKDIDTIIIKFSLNNIKFKIYSDYIIIKKKYKNKAMEILSELDTYFIAENIKPWRSLHKKHE